MKARRVVIKNIGMIADTIIDFNKPLILFFGEIRQGKTTLLNAIKLCFGGSYPADIIRHGEREASVTLEVDNGMIRREWYIKKDGSTTARSITYIRDGEPVKNPTDEIKQLLNPFLMDQEFFSNKSELNRNRYFTEMFEIDTIDLDTEYKKCEDEARDLRATIKGYGDIDLTEHKPINIEDLKKERSTIQSEYEKLVDEVDIHNKEVLTHNNAYQNKELILSNIHTEIETLEEKLSGLKRELGEARDWLAQNPIREERKRPEAPDTTDIDTKISDASANNVRAEQYQENRKRANKKQADEKQLSTLAANQRGIKRKKIAKLTSISKKCGIKNLSFNEGGSFTYQGTQSDMLSTSQIMDLSSELSNLYPEGLGLDLIDHGESLGKSIFDYVKRAEAEDKTILATIVGEKPAIVPENVGVFVVQQGEVKELKETTV